MDKITKRLDIGLPPEITFKKFVDELNAWWPKEYTWSQDKLVEIKIDGKKDGLCTEIGPNSFRCDWGTVAELTPNEFIHLKWQISPKENQFPTRKKQVT